jgi:predicted TIM-barrel fold metal-dependent hydrolase
VLETMGSHMVMYASDYPHWDCEFPESVRMLASIPGLTDDRSVASWAATRSHGLVSPR